MKIILESCDRDLMRQTGDGDWFWEDGTLHIKLVPQEDDNHTFLFGLHELVEAWLCRDAEVSEESVDAFDNAFVPPVDDVDAEPGDAPTAPYREQHRQAMLIEMLMANFLGMSNYGVIR